MLTLATTLIGLAVASFMLYFPYWRLRRTGESEEAWGLKWYMAPGAWRETLAALLLTLVPLTFVSLHWPVAWGGPGPHSPSFWNALDLLGGGLAAAFIEETFFRGWLQTLWVRRWGPWVGLPAATLVFALSHLIVMPGWLRLATFFPGLVMALLRHRHGSVLPSIIYHAVCNVWAVWWAPLPAL
ncbi:MAG: CPBP family intramembrane metalloprotease [Fretibacterium sp.]|nr:CPBP family intramembrane metalloprotease [Fretibacterium sp.]